MIRFKKISFKKITRQTLAIVEKELYLRFRYKSTIVSQILNPLIQILILIFLFGIVFNIQAGYSLGYWNANNYVLFILIAFCLQIFRPITEKYFQLFVVEKYWKTLSATLIAPINKFSLLLGQLISWVVLNSVGFIVVFVIALILFPINIFYFLLFLLAFICIWISFASIGLLMGVFGISNENFGNYFSVILRFIFLFTCINYPKEVFPQIFQSFVLLNPLYYIVDLLRLIWYYGLNPTIAMTFITPIHIITFIISTILLPIASIAFFEYVYKRYGITGY